MGKRFVASERWNKLWFRKLPCRMKCFWSFLCDNCDAAGVWEPDFEHASYLIGETITAEDIGYLKGQILVLPSGAWFLAKFIEFQYGKLAKSCLPHQRILRLLAKHGISPTTLLPTLLTGVETTPVEEEVEEDKEEEEEEDQDQDRGAGGRGRNGDQESYHREARTVLHLLNEAAGTHYRETDKNLACISARLREPDVGLDGVKTMIERQCKAWGPSDMAQYLRPETLFGVKFDGYYGQRDKPIGKRLNPKNPEGTAL